MHNQGRIETIESANLQTFTNIKHSNLQILRYLVAPAALLDGVLAPGAGLGDLADQRLAAGVLCLRV
jgi:hypothetical protein